MTCTWVNGIPKLDSEGVYFEKQILAQDGIKVEKIEKVRPTELGFSKTASEEIVVQKSVRSTDSLEDELISFFMTLNFSMEDNKANKFCYFYKTRSGEIFLKDFSGFPYPTSKVSVNDSNFVKRSRARKCPEDTILKPNTPIFTLNASGELERQTIARNPYSL